MSLTFFGQNTSNPKNTKPTNTQQKQSNVQKQTAPKTTNPVKKEIQKPKTETKKPEVKKTETKKPEQKKIENSKPNAIKEKPKNTDIESLLLENTTDTTKIAIDSINMEEEKEDTVIVNIILPEEISKLQKGKAYIIGKRILSACNTSKIQEFKEEDFSERILRKFSLDYLSNICININRRFGDFEDLIFKEALRVENQNISIYRFKVVYTKKFFLKELRVYMNDQNKITALKTLPWKPEFKIRQKRKLRKQVIDSLLIREKDSLFKDSLKILENKNFIKEKVDKSFILE